MDVVYFDQRLNSIWVLRTQNGGWSLYFQHFCAKKLKNAENEDFDIDKQYREIKKDLQYPSSDDQLKGNDINCFVFGSPDNILLYVDIS